MKETGKEKGTRKNKIRRGLNSRGTVVLSRLAARTHTYVRHFPAGGGLSEYEMSQSDGRQADSGSLKHTAKRRETGRSI